MNRLSIHRRAPSRRAPHVRGFSLLEIVIAVALLATLAAVVAMRSGGAIDKGKVGAVLQSVDSLKTACVSYHADTGSFAWEYSGYSATDRKLSGTQTAAGWAGPYLEAPLASGQNPWNGTIHVYATSATAGQAGFDVDGDGAVDVTSNSNMLYLSNVPATAAQSIDNALDKGAAGTWSTSGRVTYTASGGVLRILLHY
ncbi:MAG: prepilin-type N-terminal cleavage/methylation domain-containing protein [Planctomycetes bacterium]|nr:prepilin-type N-terminal cleavage/methylation domain-containing protein [Planctomycetota bacterium]